VAGLGRADCILDSSEVILELVVLWQLCFFSSVIWVCGAARGGAAKAATGGDLCCAELSWFLNRTSMTV